MNKTLLKSMLRHEEGLRLHVYKDTEKYNTIGYGWRIGALPMPADIAIHLQHAGSITPEMAERLLNISVDEAIQQTLKVYPSLETYTERRQVALADFVYNVGVGTALTFKNTNKAIYEGRWEDAARGFENSKWFRQVKGRAVRIVEMIREG